MPDIYVDGLCIISVKVNFEKSSIITYLLSVDALWRHRLDWFTWRLASNTSEAR